MNTPLKHNWTENGPASIIDDITGGVDTDEGIELLQEFIMEHATPETFEAFVRRNYEDAE